MSAELLRARLPGLRLPSVSLCGGETPIERAEAGDRGGARLWVKREDLAGTVYGGNKVRKLEWILPDVAARGGELLTLGGVGSNYLVAAALYGPAHGVSLRAVVFPQPDTEHARQNAALLNAYAASVQPAGSMVGLPWAGLKALIAGRRAQRPWPSFVWAGGTGELGDLGWVAGALEIEAQVKAGLMPPPTDLFVPVGSGGTAVGLTLGLGLTSLPTRVHGVRVVEGAFISQTALSWLGEATARRLRASGADCPPYDPARLVLHDGVIGAGYGHPTPAGEAARAFARDSLGLTLDPTYTGKALARCLEWMATAQSGSNVLFINTYSSRHPELSLEAHQHPLTGLLTRL
ncbi:MAG: pyridoxal-phosphate dependent enzyme [Deltaproteobacteria bacterium]|nr:pyridoxal-phosphate dependent enzyme [Deltaproteobacteria bacterium]